MCVNTATVREPGGCGTRGPPLHPGVSNATLPPMSYAADLHLHSSYAMATSPSITLESMASWAAVKGIDLLAAADLTHPVWLAELKAKLEPLDDALEAQAHATARRVALS